jgi:hypothetical protein
MGMMTKAAVMVDQGVDQHEAAAQFVEQAVERTAGLDPYAQETSVARVQRALRGESGPEQARR